MKKISIIGNGDIGQAIFYLLKKNPVNKSCQIEIYDKDKKKNKKDLSLEKCISGADFIFLCIPSWAAEQALSEIIPLIDKKTILISLWKGLNINGKTADQLIMKRTKNYALLSGPMFAQEIKKNMPSFAILATQEEKVHQKIAQLFEGSMLKLKYSNEIHSVAMSAVLKNIYTLLFGIVDGFKNSNNLKGFLATESLREMSEIMKILELKEKIIYEISGLGDFIATAESQYSKNRKVGIEIYKNGKATQKSEGLVSLPPLLEILDKKSKELIILSLLKRIIIQKKNPKTEVKRFLENL